MLVAEADLGEHGIKRAQGHIVLEDIGFSYPGDERRVLEGVSLTIAAGQMVALLVGPVQGNRA